MKRYCKNVDITDRTFIKSAINDCLHGSKGKNKFSRNDVLKMFQDYSGMPFQFLKGIATQKQYWMFDGIINTITDSIQNEIKDQSYKWKPIWYSEKLEGNKIRKIGIQDIKQQLYDYIAVNGLMELFKKKIGYYQCAAIPGKGQVMGKKSIEKWLKSGKTRYGWKGDVSKYYENINKNRLKELLKKYVKNDALLHLTFSLIDSFEKGLSIGSYLSQYLANFYMSFAYHYISEKCVKTRITKHNGKKIIRLVRNVLIYMDDIFITASNLKYLKIAVDKFKKWISEFLSVKIKPNESWIDFKNGYVDMMGFLISKRKTIVRPSIFRKFRRSIVKARKQKKIKKQQAYRIVSRWGWLANSDCKHFIKRSNASMINRLSKEVISHGEDVVYFTTKQGARCCIA